MYKSQQWQHRITGAMRPWQCHWMRRIWHDRWCYRAQEFVLDRCKTIYPVVAKYQACLLQLSTGRLGDIHSLTPGSTIVFDLWDLSSLNSQPGCKTIYPVVVKFRAIASILSCLQIGRIAQHGWWQWGDIMSHPNVDCRCSLLPTFS